MEEREFKELCRQKAPAALKRLEEIAQHETGMTRLLANEYLCDRAYGKPRQEVELEVGGSGGGLIIMVPPETPDG